jgi:nucleoside-triphosphatase
VRVPLAVTAPVGLPRVGKYRVLSDAIRDVGVPGIMGRADFIVIDEIGKMGSSSVSFMRAVHTVLAGPSIVIATIAVNGNPFIEGIKTRPDVRLFEVTRKSRDSLTDVILESITVRKADDNGRVRRYVADETAPG